jgi:glycerol-3-phosphate acyltransferase PlsX
MRIAVDAMGGDDAPGVVVQGASQAAMEWGIAVTFVGDRDSIEAQLADIQPMADIQVHHCEETVRMDEAPIKALRQKKDASVSVAFDLVKGGEADGVVSAGNSGATLAAAILTLGRIEGIERPALPGILPVEKGRVMVIDVGANVDCRPEHLFQFGMMADAFARTFLMIDNPKIGLLSIGEEGGKGNEQVRSAHDFFQDSCLNFIGNVEGRDIFSGQVQIVVCDGFVGNVVLKLSEGLAEGMVKMLKEELLGSLGTKAGHLFNRETFKRFTQKVDYAEYGGAPILGIKGVGIVCHGRSSVKAIKNAVKMAHDLVKEKIQDKLSQQINVNKGLKAKGKGHRTKNKTASEFL